MFVKIQLKTIMKKLSFLFSLFILLSAFTCENEPLDSEIDTSNSGNLNCEAAAQEVATAALAFISAGEGDYPQLCSAYKTALENLLAACGDPDGSIQSSIDALGDCSDPNGFDDCEALANATNLAEVNFNNATDDNYADYCNAYKLALENQIAECGDNDGSLQAIVDDLGECVVNVENPDQELSLFAGTAPIDFEDISVAVENGMVKVTGVDTSPGSVYSIYFEVPVDTTGEGLINDTFELTLTSVFYPSELGPPFDFVSNITVNEAGNLVGSFGGVVTNADGGDLSITSGVINISY